MIRLIKKYKNRRLYDTEISQYITIVDLQNYVLKSVPFRVEDSETKADLTNSTLLQIIVEMENGNSQFLSEEILRQLIIMSQHPMQQAFKKTLTSVFDLKNYQQVTQDWLQEWQNFFK